jgi:peptide chain release factor 2
MSLIKIGGIFEIDSKIKDLNQQKERLNDQSLWNDHKLTAEISSKIAGIEKEISGWIHFRQKAVDMMEMVELAESENDTGMLSQLEVDFQNIEKDLQQLEIVMMFKGEFDKNYAFLNIHPGAGGTESQDWAEMLLRMYQRWVERHGYDLEIVNLDPGEVAGLKDVTLFIKGKYAYGYLSAENGIHRLVRLSPFNANDKRQTSFCSVSVSPEINDEIVIDIDPKDLKIDTYRASGAGGQYVNKTESAVRITHLPTGIVVACQIERSQLQNRDMAMKMLKSKLYEYEKRKQEEEKAKREPEKKAIGWGNQIRSYVFQPYTMVKDHRTNIENKNVQAVMDGDIDDFIIGYLKGFK